MLNTENFGVAEIKLMNLAGNIRISHCFHSYTHTLRENLK
jgi:hypothetical protein